MKIGFIAGLIAVLAVASRAGRGAPGTQGSPTAGAQAPDCRFRKGADAAATLNIRDDERRAIPLRHIVVVMQENRSFDHYFGMLAQRGQPDADGIPAGFSNPDALGRAVPAHHLASTCLHDDPPHQWDAMHKQWNGGRMDGFVRVAASSGGDGHQVMGYYDESDLPFYYWLGRTFAISDRHFSAVLGGTWHNRHFMYAATSTRRSRNGQLLGVA